MTLYTVNKVKEDIAEVTVRGIAYNFDDRSGKWSIWNIASYLVSASEITDKYGIFMDLPTIRAENMSTLQIKQVLKVNPQIYNLNFLSDTSFLITKTLCEPGNSSNSIVLTMVDLLSGSLLVEQNIKFVVVNNDTRKSMKNPDWFIKKYSYLKDSRRAPKELEKREIPKPPNGCFEYRTVVRFSDYDINFHMNQSVYIRLCLDCATDASRNKKLEHFTGDITFYPVLDISIDFLGECFAGDEIVVKMWQDEKNMSELKFAVFKVKDMIQITYIVCHIGLNKFNSKMLPLQLRRSLLKIRKLIIFLKLL